MTTHWLVITDPHFGGPFFHVLYLQFPCVSMQSAKCVKRRAWNLAKMHKSLISSSTWKYDTITGLELASFMQGL